MSFSEFDRLSNHQQFSYGPILDQTKFFPSFIGVIWHQSTPKFNPLQTFQTSPSRGASSSEFVDSFSCFRL